MDTEMLTALERAFSALSRAERETIIRHGVALRFTAGQQRLFLAESKIRSFAERYHTTLEQLDVEGSPMMRAMNARRLHLVASLGCGSAQACSEYTPPPGSAQQGLFGEASADVGD